MWNKSSLFILIIIILLIQLIYLFVKNKNTEDALYETQKSYIEYKLKYFDVENKIILINQSNIFYKIEYEKNNNFIYNYYYKLSTLFKLEKDGINNSYKLSNIVKSVLEVCEEENIDPDIVFSIIWAESRFNELEHNNLNATGLMQIIPKYHKKLLKTLSIKDKELFNPYNNILVGTKIFKSMYKQYGNVIYALYRYNGGTIRNYKKNTTITKESFYYAMSIFEFYYNLKNFDILTNISYN